VTGKELMIVDLQGAYNKSENGYILTDPAIAHSRKAGGKLGGAARRTGIGAPAKFRPTATAPSRSGE
jgi:hypothetical protein